MLYLASRSFIRRIPTRTRSLSSLPDGYKIRRARVWRNSNTSRWIFGTAFVLAFLYETSKTIAKRVGVEHDPKPHTYSEYWEQKRKSLRNQEEKEVDKYAEKEEEENRVFIPLTWPSKRPIEPYDGDSPEWEALLELSRDQQQVRELMAKLREIAVAAAFHTKNISMALGYGNVAVKQDMWMEFPQSVPQEYECSGLELSEDGSITWKARVVDVSRLRKYGLPYATVKGLWTGNYEVAKALYGQIKQKFDVRFGDSSAVSLAQAPAPSPPSATQVSPHNGDAPPSVLFQAASVLRRTFHRNRPPPLGPVRGSCRIMGILHLSGTQGRCRLLIQGDYLPIQRAWVGISIQLYSISPNVIRPREKQPQPQQLEDAPNPSPSPADSDSPSQSGDDAPTPREDPLPGDLVKHPTEESTKDPSPPPKEDAEKPRKRPPSNGPTAEGS